MAQMPLTIRPAEQQDSPALADIYEQSWRLSYQGIIPHIILEQLIAKRGPGWWQRILRKNYNIFLLEFDGAIAGYATIGRNRWPNLPFSGEIQELYLQPQYQGLGFGKQLFGCCRKTLERRGFNSLIVWALKENISACLFYARRGGKPVANCQEQFGTRQLEKVAFGWRQDS